MTEVIKEAISNNQTLSFFPQAYSPRRDFLAGRKILLFFFKMTWFKLWAPVKGQGFLDIQNNMKIRGSLCVSRSRSSANKEQPNLFVKAQKFGMGYFEGLFLVEGIIIIIIIIIFISFFLSPRNAAWDFFIRLLAA